MDWRHLLTQYKWHIFLALLALVLYILFLGPNNILGYRIYLLRDLYSDCHIYCNSLTHKYSSVETVLNTPTANEYCNSCEDYSDFCNIILIDENETIITLFPGLGEDDPERGMFYCGGREYWVY